ncbi:hypothetical protein U9M48_027556 [Paspalum notatum var. saurae]|uniref:Reverse transcriptase Ty1/copia-type domain-containing protein n=1 Tax=Paspalum notatum var. saurae TaxID=547442 RepID=A0AAQ3TUL8_PASNO
MKLPQSKNPIGLKWVYKLKKDSEGNIIRHKAKTGRTRPQGLDIIRMIFALASNEGWEVYHMEVKLAFLNGGIEEEVYVTQPEGFIVKNKECCVIGWPKLFMAFGKYQEHGTFPENFGFKRCSQEQAVYTRGSGVSIIIGVYADDLIITGMNSEEIKEMSDHDLWSKRIIRSLISSQPMPRRFYSNLAWGIAIRMPHEAKISAMKGSGWHIN